MKMKKTGVMALAQCSHHRKYSHCGQAWPAPLTSTYFPICPSSFCGLLLRC